MAQLTRYCNVCDGRNEIECAAPHPEMAVICQHCGRGRILWCWTIGPQKASEPEIGRNASEEYETVYFGPLD
ncbi:MAG: hypothetical protein ABIY70_09015 [Capsulimonas sp.]|uniref:hypothetical protein n=1 Tax=Capsulimonas sp. TaxID=2494211 RepID=UPI0032635E5E